jgi:predicted DNA-binding transcriptional regulator YafY
LDALRGFHVGRRIAEIAKEVGTSERTVRRDLIELQDAGFEIEIVKRDQRSIARLGVEHTFSSVPITKRERFTLFAVRNVFEVLRGTPFLDDVHAIMAKLEQRMSDKERAETRANGDQFVYLPDHGTKSYDGKEDIIDALQTGILTHKVVRYRYGDGRGRGRQGFLAPYVMVMYRHGLYVIGARLASATATTIGAPRGMFAIERFTEAEHLRAHTFEIDPAFDVAHELDDAFGPHLADEAGPHDVIVEFSRERALYASSRTWHKSQQIEPRPDGRVRISFRVRHLASVVSWVLEWGPHARAIAPEGLVTQVRSELGAAQAQYEIAA